MSVCVRPVPALGDFLEILTGLAATELMSLQYDITAYEGGRPTSRHLEEVLQRAECVAEANRIMKRFG